MKPATIRALRDRLGLDQIEFGERFPVDARTIQRWEAGHVKPSPMAMHRMRELVRSLKPERETTSDAGATSESEAPAVARRRGVFPSLET